MAAMSMTATLRPAPSAIAFQLVGALESYQCDFEPLLDGHCTLERCRQVSRKLEELLTLKGALPQLSAQMVELLAYHTQLMQALWGVVRLPAARRAELQRRHREAMQALRAKCVRLFSRDAAPA
jgi:hypothetical protein